MCVVPNFLKVVAAGVVVAFLACGCGVSEKKIDNAQKRIEALQGSGIAVDFVSSAQVYLAQAITAKKLANGPLAKVSFDSALANLQKAEAENSAGQQNIKPLVDSLRNSVTQRKQMLVGRERAIADSLLALVDSALAQKNLGDAKKYALHCDSAMNTLVADAKRGEEIRPKILGNWVSVDKLSGEGQKGTETKSFNFSPDGKVELTEARNGQTNEAFKEDWKFVSFGTYSLKGDTVFIAINREKCEKQTYWNLKDENGRKTWVKTDKPTYDSTISSGSKDRFMTYDVITAMKKK